MASKYAGLKGKIPEGVKEPSERETAISKIIEERRDLSITQLIQEYNEVTEAKETAANIIKRLNLRLEALGRRIRERMDAENLDGVKADGYTWTPTFEPYPVVLANDVPGIVQYFKDHGMEEQLALKASEVAARLVSFVKEEAMNNELEIGTREVPDPQTGALIEIPDVRSKIPGVRVFLKAELSRVKSGKI